MDAAAFGLGPRLDFVAVDAPLLLTSASKRSRFSAVSEKSSKQEVAAVRIERDVEDLYKAEYMHNHLGEVYTGTVAGITPRGVFVELDNTVEGFVPAAQLCKGEPQVIDGVSMLDPLTGKSWMLGSSMKIRVAAADVALGRIDFEYMVE